MKVNLKTVLVAVSVIAISGCAGNAEKEKQQSAEKLVNDQIREEAIKITLAQNELYQAGAINRTTFRIPTVINANSQNIRVNWQGDAYELLAQMAKQRGLRFTSQGVKLPLPVNIDVGNATFEGLLALIRQQTDYRANVVQRAGELQLIYLTPEKRKSFLRGNRK